MLNNRDWSNDENWSTRILELFDVGHIPKTIGAREAVALFILGKYGSSRKTPNERAADFKAEAERFVGKEVLYKKTRSTVRFLSIMLMKQRVYWSARGKYKVGPFAAYVGTEGYSGYYIPTTRLELIETNSTSE